ESYGSQELSSVPIDAGLSKDVKLKVRPPSSVDAGSFPIEMKASAGDTTATTQLALEVVGQPRLTIAGSDGLVSARAEAGKQSAVPVGIPTDARGGADNMDLAGAAPSGWKVESDKKTIDRIAPSQTAEVTALVTPTEKSLAGDYMATIGAASRGETASTQF